MSSFVKNNDSNSTNAGASSSGELKSVPSSESKCPKYIKCLLDRSGSMSSGNMFQGLIKGVNTLLLEQKQVAEDSKVEINIEIYVFDSEINLIRSGSIMDVKDISEDEVRPRGSTALNDALASILDNSKDEKDVLLFIFTDGQENASQKHRGESGRHYCKSLIELYSRQNNWTVLFGAANIDAYQTSSMYGIDANNAFNVAPDAPTMGVMMREFSSALKTSTSNNEPINVGALRQASAPVTRSQKKSRVSFSDTNPGSSLSSPAVSSLRSPAVSSLRTSPLKSLRATTTVPSTSLRTSTSVPDDDKD